MVGVRHKEWKAEEYVASTTQHRLRQLIELDGGDEGIRMTDQECHTTHRSYGSSQSRSSQAFLEHGYDTLTIALKELFIFSETRYSQWT